MHHLRSTLRLPISLDEAWGFFSSPKNLAVITPKELNLVPTTELPSEMYPGMFIEYTVRPLLGIPMKWVTEITHVREKAFFVDEQRMGPYQIWHHQHHFKAIPGGVEMLDILDYRLPLGPLGIMMEKIMVGKKVREIFEYRTGRLNELFGVMK